MSTITDDHSQILSQLVSGPCVAIDPDEALKAHLKHLEVEGFITVKEQPCGDCGGNHGDLKLEITPAGRATFDAKKKAAQPVITINGTLLSCEQADLVKAALHALPISALELNPVAGLLLFPQVRAILGLFNRK